MQRSPDMNTTTAKAPQDEDLMRIRREIKQLTIQTLELRGSIEEIRGKVFALNTKTVLIRQHLTPL